MSSWIYILTNTNNTTLYTGVTSDLHKRINEHRSGLGGLFTARYHTHKLVYYEQHATITSAIEREKQIKSWSRQRKVSLIESTNPYWEELMNNNDI